jgi:hypothetical protein
MGGQSEQQQTQSTTSNPWEPAQDSLKGILGGLNNMTGQIPLNGAETGAINNIEATAQQGNPFASSIQNYTQNMLNGGGANDQAGAVQNNLTSFQNRLGPYADPNYSSLNDPNLRAALDQIRTDVSGQVNGMYAGAGRDPVGAGNFSQTLGRGVASGEAPLILNQFNQDQALKQGAAQNLYNAGNNTSGLLSGMTQQGNVNAGTGLAATPQALAAQNYGNTQTLQLEQLKKNLPAQYAGLLAQIGVPIAGLGGQSTGTSSGSQTMSGAQQFGLIANGIGSMIPKGPISFG